MTPQQALDNLGIAARRCPGTFDDHLVFQEALKVLVDFVANSTSEPANE